MRTGQAPLLARTFSAGIRIVSLAARFVAIIVMARFLAPTDFGAFGLIAAGVAYATFLVGADFYTYSNRELIRFDRDHQGSVLKNQAAAHGVAYLVAIPLISIAFASGLLPWSLLGWFCILLALEHVGQESMRTLVALCHPLAAALVLFFRTGLWSLAVIILLWKKPELRHLTFVLGCWAASGGLAVIVALIIIGRKRLGGWTGVVDWAWVRRGFRAGALLLVGSLALRGLFTLDRFWIDAIATPEVLGAYVFFMAIAGALPAVLEAGLFSFEYPSMVTNYPVMRPKDRRKHAWRLLGKVGLLSTVYCCGIMFLLPFGLEIVNRPEYSDNLLLLVAGMAAMVLYVVGLVPHFALYALDEDKAIVFGNVLAFLVFFPATLAFGLVLSAEAAVPVGLCVSFGVLFCWKGYAFRRVTTIDSLDMAEI